MIRVELSARMQKTAAKLPEEVRAKASAALRAVAEGFGQPQTTFTASADELAFLTPAD